MLFFLKMLHENLLITLAHVNVTIEQVVFQIRTQS